MEPLRIDARINGEIALGLKGYIHLDALLAKAAYVREQIPQAWQPEHVVPIEIPIQRSECGRFHLASASIGTYEQMAQDYVVRRFPAARARRLLAQRRINTQSGPHRDFRFPLESGHLVEDRLTWFCVGERAEIVALLSLIHHLGKKRASGKGEIADECGWTVEPCEPWPGFPVLSPEGHVLRHLPIDYPGAVGSRTYGRLTYPYHHLGAPEELVLAPCR